MSDHPGWLFVMPEWGRSSEVWLMRMLRAMETRLAGVAAFNSPPAEWTGRVPTTVLRDEPPSTWRRVAGRLGMPVERRPRRTAEQLLAEAVGRPEVTHVLVHFIPLALKYSEVWERSSRPLFVHAHGYDVTWDHRSHQDPERRTHPADYVDRVLDLSRRAILIANSRTTASRLREIGVPEGRIHVKYLGVPVPEAPPRRATDDRPLEVLYLGRLVDFKGPDRTVAAFEAACDAGLDGRLRIAGDGILRASCELAARRSRHSDRIELLGFVEPEQAQRLLLDSDVFTAHSIRGELSRQEEAFGVSFVEAMAAALPVVSGRSGSLPEIVDDGTTGILFEPGDVQAQAEALLRLGGEPGLRRRLGEAGWRRAREHYSLERERQALARLHEVPG